MTKIIKSAAIFGILSVMGSATVFAAPAHHSNKQNTEITKTTKERKDNGNHYGQNKQHCPVCGGKICNGHKQETKPAKPSQPAKPQVKPAQKQPPRPEVKPQPKPQPKPDPRPAYNKTKQLRKRPQHTCPIHGHYKPHGTTHGCHKCHNGKITVKVVL